MTNLFGHEVRSELLFLYLTETLAVFLAVYALMALGMTTGPGVDYGRLGLLAGSLAYALGWWRARAVSTSQPSCSSGAAWCCVLLLPLCL